MSQSGRYAEGTAPIEFVTTLTGNSGGAVPPTGNNINIVGAGGVLVTGNPGTSTLTITSPAATLEFDTDSGTAMPDMGVIDIIGGENINTAGATNVVTVNLNETIHWPDTDNTGVQGAIYLGATSGVGGDIFMHNYSASTECTFLGQNAGGDLTTVGTDNTGIGSRCLQHLAGDPDFAGGNTAVGSGSLSTLVGGGGNTGIGNDTLAALVDGFNNFAGGDSALFSLEAGDIDNSSYNVAIGAIAGLNLLTGSFNVLLGSGDGTAVKAAGQNYTGMESSNIVINNGGTVGDNNIIRIGTNGSGNGQQNKCFIAGIFGTTIAVSGIPVNIDNTGQLGTVVSSRKFKRSIEDMGSQSEDIYKLRPVTFELNEDPTHTLCYGLIAEEVEQILPTLVAYDHENKPFSVKYNDLPVLLLNEIQKQRKIIDSLLERITVLEQKLTKES